MKATTNKPIYLLYIAALLLLSSCAEIRLLTYPADFTWIGKEQIKSAMHGMGNSISKINSLLEGDFNAELQQDLIVKELDNIESYAASLSGGTEWSVTDSNKHRSNHLLLNDNIDEFIDRVGTARLQAQSQPTNYYGAGRIIGGCLSCHRIR